MASAPALLLLLAASSAPSAPEVRPEGAAAVAKDARPKASLTVGSSPP